MSPDEVLAVTRLRDACTAALMAECSARDSDADEVDHELVRPLVDILRRECRHVERLLGTSAAAAATSGRPL